MERKFQYSKFLGDNREEQIVIRCDTWAEFVEAGLNIGINVEKIAGTKQRPEPELPVEQPKVNQTPNKTGTPIPVSEFEKTCPRCGPGVFVMKTDNRIYCGKCRYTEFIKSSS